MHLILTFLQVTLSRYFAHTPLKSVSASCVYTVLFAELNGEGENLIMETIDVERCS